MERKALYTVLVEEGYGSYDRRETGEGRWDYEWEEHKNMFVRGAALGEKKGWSSEFVYADDWDSHADDTDGLKPGDIVHVVSVRYSDGDTFGHSTGNFHLVGVYRDYDEAKEVEKSIDDNTYEGYKCWGGYFNSLERVDLDTLVLQGGD